MVLKQRLAAGIQKLIDRNGTAIRIRYFTQTIGSVWDDDSTLAVDSNLWTSGIILPLNLKQGSSDSIALEQGKLIEQDRKLFVHGSLILTGSEIQLKIQIGSPTGDEYSMLPVVIRVDAQNEPIYKQVYIRQIGGVGSLLGE
ncbi:MAG: hypothetical protein IH948_04665 [Bacteroidetes bacterium]|nr:hypothetical protein [Bacteroidota bacterium]